MPLISSQKPKPSFRRLGTTRRELTIRLSIGRPTGMDGHRPMITVLPRGGRYDNDLREIVIDARDLRALDRTDLHLIHDAVHCGAAAVVGCRTSEQAFEIWEQLTLLDRWPTAALSDARKVA